MGPSLGGTTSRFESHTTPNLGVCITAFFPHTRTPVRLQRDRQGWSILPPPIIYYGKASIACKRSSPIHNIALSKKKKKKEWEFCDQYNGLGNWGHAKPAREEEGGQWTSDITIH